MTESVAIFLLFSPMLATFIWFVENIFFGVTLSATSFIFSTITSIFISYILIRPKFTWSKIKLPKNKICLMILVIITLITAFNIYETWYWPISTEFDALTMYDYRGKLFFIEKNITGINNAYHGSYPLYTSLGHSALYFFNFQNPKLFYSFLLVVFLILFYKWIKQKSNTLTALIGVLLLISTPPVFHNARIAYTNFTYLVYLGGSLLFLSDYLKKGAYKYLLYQSLLMAGAAWTRPATHPFFLVCLVPIIIKAIKTKKYVYLITPVLSYIAIAIPWQYYQTRILAVSTFESKNATDTFQIVQTFLPDIPAAVQATIKDLFELRYAGGTMFFVSFLYLYQLINEPRKIVNTSNLVLFLSFMTWFLLCLLVRTEFREYSQWVGILYDSMRRLFIFIVPILIGNSLLLPFSQKIITRSEKSLT